MAFYSRKSPRIPNFDYSSANYYFVTICTHEKSCIFGANKQLNEMGMIAHDEMRSLFSHYDHVSVDNFIIMPNHIHAIVVIGENEQNKADLSAVIGAYKSGVSRKIRKKYPNMCVWQRSYHDHVIRNQREYEKIWLYIQFNWEKWEQDCFYADDHNQTP